MGITPAVRATPGGLLSVISASDLISIMREFRARTLDLVVDLDDEQMIGPRLPIVNPPLWEIGHIAWFAEYWILRHLRKKAPILENGDQLYNSTDVVHDTRWDLVLPSLKNTRRFMDEVLDRSIEYIDRTSELTSEEFYFYLLATFHEGMHAEALAYTRQTLAYSAQNFVPNKIVPNDSAGALPGDAEVPGGTFLIGATPDFPFAFDNEKWAHPVEINIDFDGMRPFLIVESKRKIRCRTDKESSPGNFGITRQSTGGIVWDNFVRHEIRRGVGKGLPSICQRFRMHAFMERGQQVEVKLFRR